MPYKSLSGSESVARYVNEVTTLESPVQKELRARHRQTPQRHRMQIAPDPGPVPRLPHQTHPRPKNAPRNRHLHRILRPHRRSGPALPDDGRLTCCDVSKEWTDIAQHHWKRANLQNKITLHLAPAAQTLQKFLAAGQAATFDFAFIDADKEAYDTYYELVLQLLKPGAPMLLLDNMLRGGHVADPNHHDPSTDAIRALNQKITHDPRVTSSLLTVGDGFMLACKK